MASKFPVNVVSLLHLSVEEDSIWTAYKTVTETGIAKCKLSVSSSKVMILNQADCQVYTLPVNQKKADNVVVGKNASSTLAYFYTNDNGTRTISYCELNTTTFVAENCKESTQYLEVYGAQFDSMFYTSDAKLSLTFSIANDPIRKTILTVYNVMVNETGVTFDSVAHRAAGYVAAYASKAYVFREETYSTYGPTSASNSEYVAIYASQITNTGVIKIKNKGSGAIISTITVNVSPNSKGHYAQLNSPLPDLKSFVDPQGNFIATSRGYFAGNSLEFALDTPNFTIYNVYTWPDTVMSAVAAGTKTLASDLGGVSSNGSTIQAFVCDGTIVTNNFKCANYGTSRTLVGTNNVVAFAAESTPFDLSDRGFVAVTNDGTDTTFHMFNANDFYAQSKINGFIATSENSHYQRIGSLYTFWTVTDTKVTVYWWSNSNLSPTNTMVLDNVFFTKGVKDFCPTSVQANPADSSQTFLVSNCAGDESRIYTLSVSVSIPPATPSLEISTL